MTPKELNMENNDIIDALFEQSGGCYNYAWLVIKS
jgi:hypothetical protein